MARLTARDEERFLILRAGRYHYKRRVPSTVAHLDPRAPHVRTSLKTDDVRLARKKRDLLASADDALWASLIVDGVTDPARRRYEAAVRRAEALGFSFRESATFEDEQQFQSLVERLRLALVRDLDEPNGRIVVGAVPVPKTRISDAFLLYCDEIVADELVSKSQNQRDQWRKVKLRAVNNFIALVADKAMDDITIDDAKKVYRYWLARIAPKDGRATASSSSGNRDLGNLRVLYEAYFKHMGDGRRPNPFAGLSFSTKRKKKRPPIPTAWLKDTIMQPGALATLNDEARRIVLMMIETGARPSEICNLEPSSIRLDADVPYIMIEPREDPDDPREIKTESSRRQVPLIGVSLAAARAAPDGFPRYRNRENDLSATLNKFFRENGLFPSSEHKIYSIRHSFEDRMKNAGLGDDLRRILMGHAIDRPDYGTGGALTWRQSELRKIELAFDPSIV